MKAFAFLECGWITRHKIPKNNVNRVWKTQMQMYPEEGE